MEDNPIGHAFCDYWVYMEQTGIRPIIKGCPSSEIFSEFYNSMSALGILPLSYEHYELTKSANHSFDFRNYGNEYFVKGNMMEALNWYTKAIGKALEGSAEIGLAYGNRSAVTFHLGEYNDCLINIEYALSSKYPKNLIYKLNERKGDCLTALKDRDGAISAFKTALSSLKVYNVGESKALAIHKRIENKMIQAEKNRNKTNYKRKHGSSKLFFKLSHPPSATIECASEAVSIKYSKQYGRMVVANVDISPGDVLALERPSSFIINGDRCILFCSFCLKRCHSSVPCPYCVHDFFCNDDCRDKSWRQSHEIECSLFPRLVSIGCDDKCLLAVHSLILMTKQGRNLSGNVDHYILMERIKRNPNFQGRGFVGEKYPSESIETAYFLESCEDKRDFSNMCIKAVTAACVFQLVKASKLFDSIAKIGKLDELSQTDSIVGGMLLHFMLIVPVNYHVVLETRVTRTVGEDILASKPIGWGIFNFLALLNHSCDPNVTRYLSKNHLEVLYAIKTIKKGEQLFDNYGPSYRWGTLPVRKRMLDSRYFFTCRCRPCLEDWPTVINFPYITMYLPGANDRKIKMYIKKFNIIYEKIAFGDVDHLPFLFFFLTQIVRTYKMPSNIYNKCQIAIQMCFDYKGNCYILKEK